MNQLCVGQVSSLIYQARPIWHIMLVVKNLFDVSRSECYKTVLILETPFWVAGAVESVKIGITVIGASNKSGRRCKLSNEIHPIYLIYLALNATKRFYFGDTVLGSPRIKHVSDTHAKPTPPTSLSLAEWSYRYCGWLVGSWSVITIPYDPCCND